MPHVHIVTHQEYEKECHYNAEKENDNSHYSYDGGYYFPSIKEAQYLINWPHYKECTNVQI